MFMKQTTNAYQLLSKKPQLFPLSPRAVRRLLQTSDEKVQQAPSRPASRRVWSVMRRVSPGYAVRASNCL